MRSVQTSSTIWRLKAGVVLAALGAFLVTLGVSAQTPAPVQEKWKLELRNENWSKVFELLADKTGMPIMSPGDLKPPTGVFTITSPKDKYFTVPEVLDFINEALSLQKYVLIRRQTSFLLASTETPLRGDTLIDVTPDELEKYGKSEIVRMTIKLKPGVVPEDIVPDLKDKMGVFGKVTAYPKTNELVLIDSAGNLRSLRGDIRKIENIGDPFPSSKKVTELVPLKALDANWMAAQLKSMNLSGSPYIEADPTRNAVILRGTPAQITEIKNIIDTFEGDITVQAGNQRNFNIEKANAAAVARALVQLLRDLRSNPVVPPEDPSSQIDLRNKPRSMSPSISDLSVGYAAEQQSDPAQPKRKGMGDSKKKGDPRKPIFITVDGNRIKVMSNDPEALILTHSLVKLLTESPAGGNDFRVIRLSYVSAVDAARLLDETFNGPRTGGGGGGPAAGGGGQRGGGKGGATPGGGGMNFPGMGGGAADDPRLAILQKIMAPTPQRPETIRVVADTHTNSLLVRSSLLDYYQVRNICEKIDVDNKDVEPLSRAYVIPVYYGSATEIADNIRDAYREFMNTTPRRGPGGGPMAIFAAMNRTPVLDSSGNPRPVTLSVGVNNQTNSITLFTTKELYDQIKDLVSTLDDAYKTSTQVVKVEPVTGLDPQSLQSAIDSLQGVRPASNVNVNRNQPGPGGFRPGGQGGQGGGGGGNPRPPGRSGGQQSRGPDFFDYRVMDDPREIGLYDPRYDYELNFSYLRQFQDAVSPVSYVSDDERPVGIGNPIELNSDRPARSPLAAGNGMYAQANQPAVWQPRSREDLFTDDEILTVPRRPVIVEQIPGTPLIIIKAQDQADMAATLRILKKIKEYARGSEIDISVVSLHHQDATSLTNILNQLFNRVLISPNGYFTSVGQAQQQGAIQRPPGQAGGFQGFQGFQGLQGGQGGQGVQATSVLFLPIPRQNAILLACSRGSKEILLREIERLDQPGQLKVTPIPLKRAPAQRVATFINNLYATRYNEQQAFNLVRITFDEGSNTLFVQAGPSDLADIRGIVELIDTSLPGPIMDLRVVPLRFAVSDDLAVILVTAISEGIVAPTITPGPGVTGPGAPGGAAAAAAKPAAGVNRQTKPYQLRFNSALKKNGGILQAGVLDDIRINSDSRTNSLIITAQKETMQLILGMIRELDVAPMARADEIDMTVVPLRHQDATSLTYILNQVFTRALVGQGDNFAGMVQTKPGAVGVGLPGGPGAKAPTAGAAGTQTAPVMFLPIPRQNAILVVAPKVNRELLLRKIDELDQPSNPEAQVHRFQLKRAPVQRVANMINNFFLSRWSGTEPPANNQVRFAFDEGNNTLFVQASPADLAEIKSIIDSTETLPPGPIMDLRIIHLRNALSDDLSVILKTAISEGTVAPSIAAPVSVTSGPGAAAPKAPTASAANVNVQSKPYSLALKRAFQTLEAGVLDDIRINSDTRTNSLIISAPTKTMELIRGVIEELDVPPQALALIKIFTLKNADATALALAIQQIYLGTTGIGAGVTAGAKAPGGLIGTPGGAVAGGGGGGGVGGLGGLGAGAATGTTKPLQITLSGQAVDGAPLIDVRLSVDERTNSLIVAGSQNDLDVIEAIVHWIDDSNNAPERRSVAYRLKNALAADITTALNDFVTKQLNVMSVSSGFLSNWKENMKNVVITAEPITNTLLINATPAVIDNILHLVAVIDAMPPQVLIQAVIAEVDLSGLDEFGVEIAVQTPILFDRSIIPSLGSTGSSTTSYTATTTGTSLLAPGTSVTTSQPAGWPGMNFGGPNIVLPLGQNPSVSPAAIGFQSGSNLGVGRVSPTSNISGGVISMSSDFLSVLIRSLKTQGRIDILSRPQIMTLDNQTALLNVGQSIPVVDTSNVSLGTVSNTIKRFNVGVNLQVTPKIMPDNRVLMRVIPEVSSVVPTPVQLGNGQSSTAFNVQHFESTITAEDGETVIMGGMISKQTTFNESKVPFLADCPGIGWMFRNRTRSLGKSELLVILTPHVIRAREDMARVLEAETKRMNWMECDIKKNHGEFGMDPSLGPQVFDFRQKAQPIPGGLLSVPPERVLPMPQTMPPAGPNTLPRESIPPAGFNTLPRESLPPTASWVPPVSSAPPSRIDNGVRTIELPAQRSASSAPLPRMVTPEEFNLGQAVPLPQ